MNKKNVRKKLMTTAEALWKEVCKLRDGYKCAYCHSSKEDGVILQVDHCFSRGNKELFFDLRNATLLCQSCHFRKSKNLNNMSRIVDRIVIEREGAEWFGEAEAICARREAYIWDVVRLEQVIIELKAKRAELMGGIS